MELEGCSQSVQNGKVLCLGSKNVLSKFHGLLDVVDSYMQTYSKFAVVVAVEER